MLFFPATLVLLSSISTVLSRQVVVTVGHNTTENATAVYDPAEVFAEVNDIVVFNFTLGNHTVTQSLFSSPCTPIHITNMSINGFDSGFRDTVNGTAITQLSVLITPELASSTIWFFDYNTCAQGGVGGININENTNETLQGCANNAIRFNGTGFNTTLPSHSMTTSLISTSTPTANQTSDAQGLLYGGMTVLPLILIGLVL